MAQTRPTEQPPDVTEETQCGDKAACGQVPYYPKAPLSRLIRPGSLFGSK